MEFIKKVATMEPHYYLIGLAVMLLCFLLTKKRKHPLYPPGPPGLPLIGNVHQMGKRPYVAFRKWKIKYGDVFSIKLGRDDAVVINDPKLIRELFRDYAANGHFHKDAFTTVLGLKDRGMFNTEGEAWKEIRRFTERKLREMGYAKSSMEGVILEEAKNIVKWFHLNTGAPVSCRNVFSSAVINSLWSIVSGESIDWEDGNQEESELLRRTKELFQAIQDTVKSGVMFAPFLRHLIPGCSGWNRFVEAASAHSDLLERTIAAHKTMIDVTRPRDLIDHFLIQIGITTGNTSSFLGQRGMENMKAVLFDLSIAANAAISETMIWAMVYLSCHLTVQRKMIEEIKRVLGNLRGPILTDIRNLPYTNAVILEVLRKPVTAPMGSPHRMLEDKLFHGYFLPKHTIIFANLDSSLNDPQYWGDPENFRPERFLSEGGTRLVHNEAMIPFSAGRRQCPGEPLARDILFLFFVTIFQKFEVGPDPDNPKPNLEPESGITNYAKPFRIVVKELK